MAIETARERVCGSVWECVCVSVSMCLLAQKERSDK